MKQKLITWKILFLLFVLSPGFSFGQTTFEKHYDNNGMGDIAYDIIATHDTNYIVCGVTMPTPVPIWGPLDAWIIKIDNNGDTLWTKIYGGNGTDMIVSAAMSGNDYIFAGSFYVFLQKKQAWILTLDDTTGNIVDQAKIGGTENDAAESIKEIPGGGYFVIGSTKSFATADTLSDMWLLRLNSALDTLWTKRYDFGGEDYGMDLTRLSDGNWILLGGTCTDSCGGLFQQGYSTYLLVDSLGNILNQNIFNQGPKNKFDAVASTTDGGAIITGATSMYENFPNEDIWLIKLDSIADTLWTRHYGDSGRYDGGHSVFQTDDEGYAVAAYSQTVQYPGFYFDNVWFLRCNSSGDTLWTRWWGTDENDGAMSVKPAADGGFIMAGYYNAKSWPLDSVPGYSDYYMIKITDDIVVDINENKTINDEIQIFPNPASDIINIRLNLNTEEKITVELFDLTGRKIYENIFNSSSNGQLTLALSTPQINNGIYFLQIRTNEFIKIVPVEIFNN